MNFYDDHGQLVAARYVSLLDGQPDYIITVDGETAGTLTKSQTPGEWWYRTTGDAATASGYASTPQEAMTAISDHVWHYASMFV